ncbi:nucleotide exchange factor GrpE [Crocinitomicaceae bacterium]|nr:nucleotide exchange factor GrpE [Crocinitomicaceae bacterium]|tara:strand:+ start:5319 stop:5906 length:588 start_codon:yes stop_codon:yes gene_type:complete
MAESLRSPNRENIISMSEEKDLKNDQNEKELNDQVMDEQIVEEQESPKAPTVEDKFNELNDKYMRIHAEFDNYRKRTNKEKVDIINTANAGMMRDLLSVMDDLHRAKVNNETADDIDSVKEGFNLIFNKLNSVLEAKGLTEMKAEGEVFDSEIHEALANVPAPSKKMKGKVIEAVEKGYYLNDKVIRYAKVVVGQ